MTDITDKGLEALLGLKNALKLLEDPDVQKKLAELEARKFLDAMSKNAPPQKAPRHLGSADERCPRCGGPIETLLDEQGHNPIRGCWLCMQDEQGE